LLIALADAGIINLGDATMVEKHGRGRPRGRKNKPKTSAAIASSSIPTKRRRGCPLGSKNKKTFASVASAAEHLDVSFAQPILPQSFTGSLFSFFAFAGAQCYEQ
jgi:hypothetical protein